MSHTLSGSLAGALRRFRSRHALDTRAATHRRETFVEALEGRTLLAVTTLSNGVGDGSLSVTVDAYGAYGSAASPAGDALYDPVGPRIAQGSTFESAVYFSPANDFLSEAGIGNTSFPPVAFSSITPSGAVSSFNVAGFAFVLTQTVEPAAPDGTTRLVQEYRITNNTGSLAVFQTVRHVDGDLLFVGGFGNDFGGASVDGRFVFEFDTATDPNAATAFFGITSVGDGSAGGFTVQPFLYTDNILSANGIPTIDVGAINGDTNNDRLTDNGYDVTVSLADNFVIPSGATETYTSITIFGQGTPADILNPGILQFDSPTYTVDEAGGSVTVTVTRILGSSGTVSVDYTLADGLATLGLDYGGAAGTLVFADGQRSATIIIPILNDTLAEGDENFTITLANPGGGAILGMPTAANVVIVDDERAIEFSMATFTVNEDGGAATLTVRRTGPTSGPVTASFTTANGSAIAPEDYAFTTGTVTFADGQTIATISVPVVGDFNDDEGTETFTVTLSGPTNAGLAQLSTATVEIINSNRPASLLDVRSYIPGGRIEALFLIFNEQMERSTVADPSNYNLYLRTETLLGGPPSRNRIGIRAVEFDGNRTVTLRPIRTMRQNTFYEISIRTSVDTGVRSAANDRLDGNLDRVAGDDVVAYFGRGTRLIYSDRNGDRVRLGAAGGGAIEVLRSIDRDVRQLRVVDAVPNSTFVFGKLNERNPGDGVTVIENLILNGATSRLGGPFLIGRTL